MDARRRDVSLGLGVYHPAERRRGCDPRSDVSARPVLVVNGQCEVPVGGFRELNQELKRRRHLPIPEQGRWPRGVVLGHLAYYAVPGNLKGVPSFPQEGERLWLMALRRRSQKTRMA